MNGVSIRGAQRTLIVFHMQILVLQIANTLRNKMFPIYNLLNLPTEKTNATHNIELSKSLVFKIKN